MLILHGESFQILNNLSHYSYDEISVVRLYDYAMTLPHMEQFFPSSYPKGRSCNRKKLILFVFSSFVFFRGVFLFSPGDSPSLVFLIAHSFL
jgi:hypothetical protein